MGLGGPIASVVDITERLGGRVGGPVWCGLTERFDHPGQREGWWTNIEVCEALLLAGSIRPGLTDRLDHSGGGKSEG